MTFNPKTYPLTYTVKHHKHGLEAAEVPADVSATHALFLASIIYPPDGSLSILFQSFDGRKEGAPQLEDVEWFKVWLMLAPRLAASTTLSEERKEFCAEVHAAVCEAMRRNRKLRLVPYFAPCTNCGLPRSVHSDAGGSGGLVGCKEFR